jgi:hypothetical protein
MYEDILEIYNKLLDYSNDITATIEKGEWEYIGILVSKRAELFQITNKFVNKNENIGNDLKSEIIKILEEIKKIDDNNVIAIKKSKVDLDNIKAKLNVGQRAISAYKGGFNLSGRKLDKST